MTPEEQAAAADALAQQIVPLLIGADALVAVGVLLGLVDAIAAGNPECTDAISRSCIQGGLRMALQASVNSRPLGASLH